MREKRWPPAARKSCRLVPVAWCLVAAGCVVGLDLPAKSSAVAVEDLRDHVPEPVAGEELKVSFEAAGYTGTVAWDPDETAAGNCFQPETAYRAAVTLSAQPGYTLSGAVFTYGGFGAVNDSARWRLSGQSLSGLEIAFPATGSLPESALRKK